MALYGVDNLIKAKKLDLKSNIVGALDEEKIRWGWRREGMPGRG